jgi:hypothetical protein
MKQAIDTELLNDILFIGNLNDKLYHKNGQSRLLLVLPLLSRLLLNSEHQ